jgi:hypothetical protein
MTSSGMLRRVTIVLITVAYSNIPEDGIVHSHRRENLKCYIVFLYGGYSSTHMTTFDASSQDNEWFLQETHGLISHKTPFFIVKT